MAWGVEHLRRTKEGKEGRCDNVRSGESVDGQMKTPGNTLCDKPDDYQRPRREVDVSGALPPGNVHLLLCLGCSVF